LDYHPAKKKTGGGSLVKISKHQAEAIMEQWDSWGPTFHQIRGQIFFETKV
jgi:hypothetical protein